MTAKIQKLMSSPKLFRENLLLDVAGKIRQFGSVMDDWQREDFESLDPGWLRVTGRGEPEKYPTRAFLERPRGHSKTWDIAVQAVWALFASPRKLSGICAAGDREQASLIKKSIESIIFLNSWLSKFIEVQTFRVINPQTKSELSIIASDAATSYGLTPDFIIVDELSHWSKRGLWDSLLSAAAKREDCLLAIISNAGVLDSWQWTVREEIRKDKGWFFRSLDGPQASWITEKVLAEQKRHLPGIVFDRLWLNRWTNQVGDALSGDDITSAVRAKTPMSGDEDGWIFVAGLDLGIKRDHSAFCVLGRNIGWTEDVHIPKPPMVPTEAALVDLGYITTSRRPEVEHKFHTGSGRIQLAFIESWAPSKGVDVDLDEVEAAVLAAHERFNLSAVLYDPWQAAQMSQHLMDAGVPMSQFDFSGNGQRELASVLIENFKSKTVDLFPHAGLIRDLQKLRIVERSYGYRLEAKRTTAGHGDLGTSFALALLGIDRHYSPASVAASQRPLILQVGFSDDKERQSDGNQLFAAGFRSQETMG